MEPTRQTVEHAGTVAMTGTHIWLRYATQFSSGERLHTLEMGIPMPIGASTEERARLLREAEAGMGQLVQHIEGRVSQMLQRTAPTGGARPTSPATPVAPARGNYKPAPSPVAPSTATTASTPTVRETPPPQDGAETHQEEETETEFLPNRSAVGASMPRTLTSALDPAGNLTLSQFIELIRENLSLSPKQAMQYLNVKSLNGINLRGAMERLQEMKASGTAFTPLPNATSNSGQNASSPGPRTPTQSVPEANTPFRNSTTSPTPTSTARPTLSKHDATPLTTARPTNSMIREEPSPLAFDEEVGAEDDDMPSINENDDLEDLDDSAYALTPEEQQIAIHIINDMRSIRGATSANTGRIQVLFNVVGSQINEQQLLDIIQGVWEVPNVKKLKVDQVEKLISWAKEDDFVSEAEIVLAQLEEENYARGNR